MTIHQQTTAAKHDEFAPSEAWDAIAAAYDEHVAPGERSLSNEALDLVGLEPGETFLDVAAGPGGLGLAAAARGAHVLAIDWAPEMVARFRLRAREAGFIRVDAQVMDAHALNLENDRFDVAGSQFGVMLVPDQARALRELVRVTRPGGRVLIVAYGSPTKFEALQFFISALQSVVPEFEGLPDPPPLEFQVADPQVLADRLAAAGLVAVQVGTLHRERLELRTGDDLWRWMRGSNPIVDMILAEVDQEVQPLVRQALEGMIRERAGTAEVAVLTAAVNIGWGRKPGLDTPTQ